MSSDLTPKQQRMKEMLHAEFRRYGSATEDEIAEMYPAMRKQSLGSSNVIRFDPEDSLVSAVINPTSSGQKQFIYVYAMILVIPDEDPRELLIRRHLDELHDVIGENLPANGSVRFSLGGPPGHVNIEDSWQKHWFWPLPVSVTAGGVIEQAPARSARSTSFPS